MKKDLLKEYNRKRDFKITKEPSGKKTARKSKTLSYVIQEHHASHLHYDLRLEWEGVLKSWAVPKGPSQDPADKRLAVQTEDHPLEYGKFKGTIPEGEYGAGEVFIWDSGSWEPEGDPDFGFKKGHLVFTLKGKKLKGKWHLVRTHFKGRNDHKNWLLMKAAEERKNVSKKSIKKKRLTRTDKWPGFVPPQLPRLVTEAPGEKKWLHEIKLDGYRIQTHLNNGIATFYTRNGLNWSNQFPHLLESMGKIDAESAILDGEIVALDKNGKSDFQSLQNSFKSKHDKDLRYYIFDLLYHNGEDLREHPLLERKERLRNLLKGSSKYVLYSDHFTGTGEEVFQVSCEHQLEGIVSKQQDAPYRSGRSDLWAKTKCSLRQEFVIGGFTGPQGGRTGIGALLLGVYEGNDLRYTGKVGTGFNTATLIELKKMLTKIEISESPFAVNSPGGKGIHWVEPNRVAEVTFSNWTQEGALRAPVFVGLREDKPAEEIFVERPKKLGKKKKSEIKISSPDKILFKKEKITKLKVAKYYQAVAKHMLPYSSDRPLSLVRCPEGSEGTCFYQKHIAKSVPPSFTTFPVPEGEGEGIYLSIDSAEGLMDLVQMNAFELHAWNCHRQDIMRPDQFVMDLDPGPGVSWKRVVDAAFELKEMLEDLNLKSWVKLTGGKGVHIHVPVAPLYDWDQIKSFSQTLAMELVNRNAKNFTANMSKKLRRGKIFIDYLRNGYGATAVLPYSLRTKPLSAVALPVSWDELKKIKGPQEYTMDKALRKIKSRKSDPWKGMDKLKQKISILAPVKKVA